MNAEAQIEKAWEETRKQQAVEFLQRVITPKTTFKDLMEVMNYEHFQEIKDQLEDVELERVVTAQMRDREESVQRRARTSSSEIDQEKQEVLNVIQENPGLQRGDIFEKVASRLSNDTLAHMGYLLRKLDQEGKIRKAGKSRRGVKYYVSKKRGGSS